MKKPRIVKYAQKRPTAVYKFRYEREDGEWREITVPAGKGRFSRAKEADALALAERRLSEQFGDEAFRKEELMQEVSKGYLCPACEWLRHQPELHQSNYKLVKVTRI